MEITRLQKAMAGLLQRGPFYASVLMRQEQRADQSTKNIWTDGRTLGFNPEWIEQQDMADLETVLEHEALHVVLGHHLRMGNRDESQWNEAADFSANAELLRAGRSIPPGWHINPVYEGMSTEQIYRLRQSQEQGSEKPQDRPGSPDTGQGEGSPLRPDDRSENADWPKQGQPGEVRPMPAEDGGEMDASDLAQAEEENREMVAQCAQLARARGLLPGSLDRLAEKVLSPKVEWREVLRRWFKTKVKEDYSWLVPNRRYAHSGLYLPSRDGAKMGAVAVAVDLSGSISQEMISKFAGELQGIVEEVKPTEVIVIYFDSRVRSVEHFVEGEEIKLMGKGGGGTSFVPAVQWLEDEGIEPEAMVYLTDLIGPFPTDPGWPVLWAITGKASGAPFGEEVHIEE